MRQSFPDVRGVSFGSVAGPEPSSAAAAYFRRFFGVIARSIEPIALYFTAPFADETGLATVFTVRYALRTGRGMRARRTARLVVRTG